MEIRHINADTAKRGDNATVFAWIRYSPKLPRAMMVEDIATADVEKRRVVRVLEIFLFEGFLGGAQS